MTGVVISVLECKGVISKGKGVISKGKGWLGW